ncbi:MAG: inositol monophosphatase family protein, partial [Candidatus Binatia bacterium]
GVIGGAQAAERTSTGRGPQIDGAPHGPPVSIDVKSNAIDLVTETDRACERAILEELTGSFPDYAVLAEESGGRGESELRWVVDPLDGTTNFAHGYPQVAISIGLLRGDEALFGLVRDPLRDETFTAHRGGGAFCDGARIGVSSTPDLGTALLATGFPYDRRRFADFYVAHLKAFMMRTHGVRRAGAAALDLCWVAAGRVDGFWEWKLRPWDVAAGALIVEEAGGRTSDFAGAKLDLFGEQCLASNGALHDEMIEVLRPLLAERPW